MKHLIIYLLTLSMLLSCKQQETQKNEQTDATKINTSAPTPSNENAQTVQENNDSNNYKTVDYPVFTAKENFHDFGMITDAAPVSYVFYFTNTGNKPLIISNAQSTCGCTVPEYPKNPIAPGGSGNIKVVFNPKGKKGRNDKTITLFTNTQKGTEELKITAEIR